MDLIVQWLWYLTAFVAGSVVAWVIATRLIKRFAAGKVLADPTGQVQVKVQLSVAGAAHVGRQSVLAQLEVDTPSGFNLLNMAGETGC